MNLWPWANSLSGVERQTCQLVLAELDLDVCANQDPGFVPAMPLLVTPFLFYAFYPTSVHFTLLQSSNHTEKLSPYIIVDTHIDLYKDRRKSHEHPDRHVSSFINLGGAIKCFSQLRTCHSSSFLLSYTADTSPACSRLCLYSFAAILVFLLQGITSSNSWILLNHRDCNFFVDIVGYCHISRFLRPPQFYMSGDY